ncbi:hypothetical protein Q5752_005440 [Cryptotrichosporon argae]
MPDRAQAAAQYAAGMRAYKRGEYELAVSAFDKAIALGDSGFAVLDGKAAACNRLDAWRAAGLAVAERSVRLYGERSYKPWYRKASVLLAMSQHKAAWDATTAALTRCDDAKARDVVSRLRASVETAHRAARARRLASAGDAEAARLALARRATNFIHVLPADVLVRVAEHAVAADPNAVVRLAGVCAHWRALVLENTRFWRRLVVSARRPMDKVRLFAARAGPAGLSDITISTRVLPPQAQAVYDALAPHIATVRVLDVPRAAGDAFKTKCRALESLESAGTQRAEPLAHGWLHPDARQLRSLRLVDVHVHQRPITAGSGTDDAEPDGADAGASGGSIDDWTWTGGSVAQLAGLRTLVLTNSTLVFSSPDLAGLLRHLPTLEHFELDATRCEFGAGPPSAPLALPRLRTFRLALGARQADPFDQVHAPALRHLSLAGSHPSTGPLAILSRSLAYALPNLESLDLGHTVFPLSDLINVLGHAASMRFLNVSFAQLGNDFLEALVVPDTDEAHPHPTLIPNLTALSIAGSTEMTAGPLRRMVLSRLPAHLRPAAPAPTAAPRRSAFAPRSRPSQPRPAAPAHLPAPTTSTPSSTSTPATPATPATPSPPTPSPTPRSRPAPAPLTWLCADQCTHPSMEPAVLDRLRPHLGFLSHTPGANADPDRARGRGRWAWDQDWRQGCAHGQGCALRPDADGKAWHVHHVCKRGRADADEGGQDGPPPSWRRIEGGGRV